MPTLASGATTAMHRALPIAVPSTHTPTASMASIPTMALGRMPTASSIPNSRVRSKTVIRNAPTRDSATRIISSQ